MRALKNLLCMIAIGSMTMAQSFGFDGSTPPVHPINEWSIPVDTQFMEQWLKTMRFHEQGYSIEGVLFSANEHWVTILRVDYTAPDFGHEDAIHRMICWKNQSGEQSNVIMAMDHNLPPLTGVELSPPTRE